MKTEIACNNYFDAQLPKYTPTYIHAYIHNHIEQVNSK